jgi:hypothetical protein
MTAATVAAASTGRPRSGARLRDVVAVAWRQHRLLIILTAAGVLALAGYLLVLWSQANGMVFNQASFFDDAELADRIQAPLMFLVPALGGVAAIFWGAPLVAREYDQRTHLLAWSQDVSPGRWLMTKVALLGAILIVLAGGLELVVRILLDDYARVSGGSLGIGFYSLGIVTFESSIPLQIMYTLFGFALGLAAGVLVRRTVTAMGVSLFVFALIRWWLATFGREHYESPVYYVGPLSQHSPNVPVAAELDFGYLNAQGVEVGFPPACYGTTSTAPTDAQFAACEQSHGLTGFYTDFQPESRVPTFQLIEFGIYLVLTACCLLLALRTVRRRRQV